MAHSSTMAFKVSRLFQKWRCFGGKAAREEAEKEDSLKRNQPKIIITECKSIESTPNVSRKNSRSRSSSSSSSDSSSTPYDETEAEIKIKTDGKVHEMGMKLVLKTRVCDGDEVDGCAKEEVTSMISVRDVKLGSFAHGFGIREGDIVSKINGKRCFKNQELQDAFISKNSDKLEMEILRKKRNHDTRGAEFIKMVISNARRIGGQTENELEIINIEMGSSWSLSDNGTYFHQDPVDNVALQFATSDSPWVVRDDKRLALKYHLPTDEEEYARFYIHKYWSMSNDTGIPVVIQHAQSGLCVAFSYESIYLEEVNDLDRIDGQKPYMFNMHTELAEGSGMNMTFQSLLDRSHYIGFHAPGDTAHAEPIRVQPRGTDPLGPEHEKVVFILTYL